MNAGAFCVKGFALLEFLASYKDTAPAISAVIAFLSALVAFGAFVQARRVNRRRATLDMVLKTFVDPKGQETYIKFKEVMQKYKTNEIDILAFADPNCAPSNDRQIIRAQLNEYELIALGIKKKLFDEKLYKLWFQDQFQRDYRSLEEFISKVREQRPSVFCECVWLYNRWSRVPHPENSPGRFKVAWWGITGNTERLKSFAIASGGCT